MIDYFYEVKKYASMTAVGTALVIGVLLVSGIYSGTVVFCVCLAGALLFLSGLVRLIRSRRYLKRYCSLGEEASDYMVMLQGAYRKKLVNSIVICAVLIMSSIWSFIYMLRVTRMDAGEVLAFSNMWIAAVGVYMVVKDAVCVYFCNWLVDKEYSRSLKRYLTRLLLFMAFYWTVVVVVFSFMESRVARWNTWMLAILIFSMGFALKWLMNVDSWWIQPFINMIPMVPHRPLTVGYEEETGVYSITMPEDSDFKILQITDIHLGGSFFSARKDEKALEAVFELIRSAQPDLVIVTGDFVFPLGIQSLSFNNHAPMMQFASFMRNIGIPWAFTYGNHDTEFVASHTAEEMRRMFEVFSYKNTKNLLYSSVQPGISGRSNQMIKILNPDGSLNQALFLLDSNSYTGRGWSRYDYIHEDQVIWYEEMIRELSLEEGRQISSLLFFHIPLPEFREAYEKYKAGDPEVVCYYGEVGEKNGAISCPDQQSRLFEAVTALGSTKGIFVGHDHYNNISLEYKKVRLTFGMSIDYLAMPGISKRTEQRGATLITLHPDSGIDIRPIRLSEVPETDEM